MFENWTMNDYIVAFREMWLWISLETRKRKRKVRKHEYLLEKGFDPAEIHMECFLCQYVSSITKSEFFKPEECELCPVELNCNKYGSLYELWISCPQYEWEEAAEYAAQIAVIPLKKR